MLDSRDFAAVGYRRINKRTGKEVDWAHVVKGYEYKKGEYVALADADFKHANVKASETIQVETFCDRSQIPALYYEKPYYLSPGKGGEKVYTLLREALLATDTVALASFVMHQRQHLCAIAPIDGHVLALLTLRFEEELLSAKDYEVRAKVSSGELSMAKQLVGQMRSDFDVSRFKDTYRADLKRRVQEKIKNHQIHALEVEEPISDKPKAQVIDLMAALKASLSRPDARAKNARSGRIRKRA
jgi:DNA end-binding protein Ku